PRLAGTPGPSQYDRIMILASSRPPVVTATNPAPFTSRPMPQVQQNVPVDDDAEVNGPVPGQQNPAVMPTMPTMPGVQMQQGPANQAPMTAPRPGMLPAPANTNPATPPNPYLGAPPGPAAPGFNPNPPPPPT